MGSGVIGGGIFEQSCRVMGMEPLILAVEVLKALATQPKTKVVIISGRDKDTLGRWLGDLSVDMIAEHESFKEAKNHARQLRSELSADAKAMYKVIFAESALEAEERLMEQREEPILREWEK